MNRYITSDEFKQLIKENPYWVRDVVDPKGEIVEITDCYVHEVNVPLMHLSRLIHFAGRDHEGKVADLSNSVCLTVARGTFHGSVSFAKTNINRIDPENLVILQANDHHEAASFAKCLHLKVMTGKYPGYVSCYGSGVTTVKDLHIDTGLKQNSLLANFGRCNLKRVPAELLEVMLANEEYLIDPEIRTRLRHEDNARKLLKQEQPFIL